MNPTVQTIINILGTFAAAYGTAVAAGQSPKVAATLGVGAIFANQIGLHQTAPSSQPTK